MRRTILPALALLLLAGSVTAQTIDPADYFPLGVFNRWQFEEAGGDPEDVFDVVVKNVSLHKGKPVYNLRFPEIGDIKDVRLLFGFDDGNLMLYAARVTEGAFDDLDVERIRFFRNPVVIATPGTAVDGIGFTTVVDTKIRVSAEVGPKTVSATVEVKGSVTARWTSVGSSLVTPLQTFPAADLVRLEMTFDLSFLSHDSKVKVDDDIQETVSILLAEGVGVARVDTRRATWLLRRAILPGKALGGTFPPNEDIDQLTFPAPGLVIYQGRSAETAGDGTLALTDLYLNHSLSGSLLLTGYLDVPGVQPFGESEVEFSMKGKAKPKSDGTVKFSLKGKANHDAFAKPIKLSAKGVLTAGSKEVTIVWSAGKDEEKIPIGGQFTLPLSAITADTVAVTLQPIVDADFDEEDKKGRKLGAEGWLTAGGINFPITLLETVKTKTDGLEQRAYVLVETGTTKAILKFGATSGLVDYALAKFKGKVLAVKVKPAIEDVLLGAP